MAEEQSPQTGSAEDQREFGLQRIYTKDISYETPNSPAIFAQEWNPNIGIDLNSEFKQVAPDVYEVVLTVTVTAKVEDKTAYLVEVHQAGIFGLRNFPEDEARHMLGAYCPEVLFPYAREVVSDLVSKGSFPHLLLAPVNFNMLYAQHQQRAQQAAAAGENAG
jgi:preprotein translocase subunit SecB